jgi:hypothetical protein
MADLTAHARSILEAFDKGDCESAKSLMGSATSESATALALLAAERASLRSSRSVIGGNVP